MIKLYGPKLPRRFGVAVSGGIDSMAALSFLSANHEITAIHIDHGTGNTPEAETTISSYCAGNGIRFASHAIVGSPPSGESKEKWWRDRRYSIFKTYDIPVVTCHHLDDCVETWIWSSMHGDSKVIPYRHANVIRPFLLTEKRSFRKWAMDRSVPWVEDASNLDMSYTRNYIRHHMMPHVLRVNPGIKKTIRKKLLREVVE